MGEAIESGLKKFGVTVSKPVLARIAIITNALNINIIYACMQNVFVVCITFFCSKQKVCMHARSFQKESWIQGNEEEGKDWTII